MPDTTTPTNTMTTTGRPRAVRRLAVTMFVASMVVLYVVVAGPTMFTAVRSVTDASELWLLVGALASAASMVAFAALRGRTLAVGGARIPLRATVAVSYGAGAVHTTLPAGAVFSTSYAYRHLKALGASASATTWSMTVTGLLSTLTLSAVGVFGLVLTAGTGGSLVWPIVEFTVAVALIVVAVRVARHPAVLVSVSQHILIRINRVRRLPAESGLARLSEILDDLRAIRPTGRDWLVFTGLALLNWALDVFCLAACCAAVGVHVSFPALLITYTAGMAAASLLPLPAGLGAVETALTLGLTVAGAAASPALAAVLLYRLLSTGSVVLVGWLVIAAGRAHSLATGSTLITATH